MVAEDHNIWYMLFESTPPALRHLFVIMSGGLFALARYIWRRHTKRVDELERRMEKTVTIGELHTCRTELLKTAKNSDEKLDRLVFHLLGKNGDNE